MLLALLACDGKPADPVDDTSPTDDSGFIDMDGDGSPASEDCDDNDEYSNPDAGDVPYDGVDQDCDGADLVDVDGDGYIGDGAGATTATTRTPR